MRDVTGLDPAQKAVLDLRLDGLALGGREILGDIALTVQAGETVALTGPSGIGKTSLLRIVAGLETRFEGELRAPAAQAMVFQEPTLLPWRTAEANLCITAKISPEAARAALADVGLADHAGHYPGALSLGQQRRLALARAFAASPDLLLMDEPFVSLDPALADEMMGLFVRLRDKRRTATLLVTHVEDEAARLSTRILRLGGSPARIVDTRETGHKACPRPNATGEGPPRST